VGIAYAAALEQAKTCDPEQSEDQCTAVIGEGLLCACNGFANPQNADAIESAGMLAVQFRQVRCAQGATCGKCAPPTSAYCSPAGRCENVWDLGAEAGCKVEGMVYPSGSSGIPDPTSCNTCECTDGQLSCTEINCPRPCPPDSAFGTQCAGCGPADACEVVEHGCLPVCTDTCEAGSCIDGLCRTLCG
jgi:hypothetical protein